MRPLVAGWDAGELARLLLVDLIAFLPFLGAGLAIGQVFMRWPRTRRGCTRPTCSARAAGSAAATALLAVARVETAIAAVAAVLALLGTTVALARRRLAGRGRRRRGAARARGGGGPAAGAGGRVGLQGAGAAAGVRPARRCSPSARGCRAPER
ncbi:MAG: hypothetical protein U5K43_12075 [Halofilum sp. (in: g-proteobacteria)]|nr:hypothetical protein [Halofilum sp. (in: g-proteobacteria)]